MFRQTTVFWSPAQPTRTSRSGVLILVTSTSPSSPTEIQSPKFNLSEILITSFPVPKTRQSSTLMVTHMMKFLYSTTSLVKFGPWQHQVLEISLSQFVLISRLEYGGKQTNRHSWLNNKMKETTKKCSKKLSKNILKSILREKIRLIHSQRTKF